MINILVPYISAECSKGRSVFLFLRDKKILCDVFLDINDGFTGEFLEKIT